MKIRTDVTISDSIHVKTKKQLKRLRELHKIISDLSPCLTPTIMTSTEIVKSSDHISVKTSINIYCRKIIKSNVYNAMFKYITFELKTAKRRQG